MPRKMSRIMLGPVFLTTALCHASAALALPDGEGREAVEAVCTACHGVNLIERSSGYSRDDWEYLISTMIDVSGDSTRQDDILDYLAEHFPPSENRAATPVDGPLSIRFEAWRVPTPGQRSRDPVEAPDGSIWWVGQWRDILGRIDPETGEMEEFALPSGARPHSVNIGPDGAAWYTGNRNATLGRFDPQTGEITEYPMPDEAARDPHTAEFAANGILWFSLQQSNMIGRLDPATGEVRLVTSPRQGSRPYGVKIASDGTVWVACNGANCLLRVAPESMAVSEPARARHQGAPARYRRRRHHLVGQFRAGPAGSLRSRHRRYSGMGLAQRRELPPLRDRRVRRGGLV